MSFSPPERNNFVDLFVPLSRDLNLAVQTIHQASEPLNALDGRLLRFIQSHLQQFPHLMTQQVFEHLIHWEGARKQSSFLAGVTHLEAIVGSVNDNSVEPFADLAQREVPELLESYCSLPAEFSRALRVNLYLPPRVVARWVDELAELLRKNSALSRTLGRVEVARVPAKVANVCTFPTLMLYLSPGDVGLLALDPWKEWLAPRLEAEEVKEPPAEFADAWHNGSTITEGYKTLQACSSGSRLSRASLRCAN